MEELVALHFQMIPEYHPHMEHLDLHPVDILLVEEVVEEMVALVLAVMVVVVEVEMIIPQVV